MPKKATPKTQQSTGGPSSSKIAAQMLRFQKRREKAQIRINSLMNELDQIDGEIKKFLKDVPVLL